MTYLRRRMKMFKLKDDVWVNPDEVSQICVANLPGPGSSHEIRVYTSNEYEAYYIAKSGSREEAVAEAEKLVEAIEAGTTRDRLNCLVNVMSNVIDVLRERL
jgi:L-alanine-DL-glutamate epimerase-like enolase superfamily enzyme